MMTKAARLRFHNRCKTAAITALFLSLQIGSIWHLAEYGDVKHSHAGVACIIGVIGDSPSQLNNYVPSALASFGETVERSFSPDQVFRKSTVTAHLNIRAPPALPL